MIEITPNKEQERICYCSGTTKQEIQTLIDNGTTNYERISRITGAGSGCGGCESQIMELLKDNPADL